MKKQDKGITLIALVLTIIVLLILAGVSIATLTGDDGILTQAANAKNKTNIAQAQEEVDLAMVNLEMEKTRRNLEQNEKADFIKKELVDFFPAQEPESGVTLSGKGFSINHRGFNFKITEKKSNGGYDVSYKEPFDATSWDEKASPAECFIWLSDDPNSQDYGTIIGYTSSALGYTTLKIPSRCKRVEFTYNSERYSISGTTRDDMRSVQNIKEVELPETVTSIGNNAFTASYFCSLEKINIPESLTTIGEYAFYNTNITNVIIPDSVTSIGREAFSYCSSLSSVEMPYTITSIGERAFSECSSLTSITIPEGITTLEYGLFSGCSSLSSVEIPYTVTSIRDSVFSGCSSLSSVTIPESITILEYGVFSNCSSLGSINIPDGVTSIASSVFSGCSSLTTIDIPDGVTSIGDSAFSGCSSLTTIDIPDVITTIESYMFSWCTSLTDITIKDTVTSINSNSFYNCTSLTSITIPESVTNIGYAAFAGCSNLSDINIENENINIKSTAFDNTAFYNNHPNGIIYIGKMAYKYKGDMPANTSIVIKEGTERLSDELFLNQANLINIEIPASMTNINQSAFSGAGNLESINVSSENQVYSSVNGIVYNKDQTTILMVPPKVNTSMLPSNVKILECSHPYSNSMSQYYTTTISGASKLNLSFSSVCYLEDYYDYIEIYNKNGALIYSSKGKGKTDLAGKNITVDGDTVKIRLKTDYSVTYWGFMCIVQPN